MQRIIIRAFQTMLILLVVIIIAFLIIHINETNKYNELKGRIVPVDQNKVAKSENLPQEPQHFILRPGVDPTPVSYSQTQSMPTLFGKEGTVEPFRGNVIISTGNSDNTSFQEEIKNLQRTKSLLVQQLDGVNKRLASLEIFLTAQQSLKLTWMQTQVPQTIIPNAFSLTLNGKSVQICRASFMHGLHPGIVKPEGCLITYAGYAAIIQSYEILIGAGKTEWKRIASPAPYQKINLNVQDTFGKTNSIPIQIGFENNTPLYLCKVTYENQEYIGKVIDDNCDFAVGPKEIYLKEFEVLFGEKAN